MSRIDPKEFGWQAHVAYSAELDTVQLFVVRRESRRVVEYLVPVDVRAFRPSEQSPRIQPFIENIDTDVLRAIADGIREFFGADNLERMQEARIAGAEARSSYVEKLVDRLLTSIDRLLLEGGPHGS